MALIRLSLATKTILVTRHRRSLRLLCTVGGDQARSDARSEFEILERSPKGGGEASRAQSCSWLNGVSQLASLSIAYFTTPMLFGITLSASHTCNGAPRL